MMAVPIYLPLEAETLEVGAATSLFTTRLAYPANQQFGYAVDPAGQRFLMWIDPNQATATPLPLFTTGPWLCRSEDCFSAPAVVELLRHREEWLR